MEKFSFYIIPTIIFIIVGIGLYKKIHIFDLFLKGAKEGFLGTVSIAPSIIGLITAVSMLKASGALDIFTSFMEPFAQLLKIPTQTIPLMLLRPISGSGSLALIDSILGSVGPDSFPGRVASVMMGSTETTFYAIAVYFGAVGIKNTRHAIPAALAADISGFLFSSVVVCLLFKNY
ncbi:MAG: Spore maturation protein B [Eubacteriales bacterium SKADARSKE-1]|nr:Spore maturation protein B [Eubacteriales bacterium SKADARSKE-1]